MSFTHLHVHTEFSLLDGANRISGMMDHLKKIGQNAIAITDHGVMYGVVDFYRAAKGAGIKPIIGCEVYVAPRSRFDKVHGQDNNPYHLILLCKNQEGYRNLIHMVSLSFSEGFYNRPRVDKNLLREYSGGLIALSGCIAGEVSRELMANNYAGAKRSAEEYREIFGEGNFYLEIQDHGLREQKDINPKLFRLSEELNIPIALTNDAHYTSRQDAYLQDVLMCIQTGHSIDDPDRMRFETEEFYLKSEEEMRELFPDHPEVLENTQIIADQCNVEFEFGKYHLPVYAVPEGYTAKEYLHKLCMEGLRRHYGDAPDKQERLEYELDMIEKMGFVDYFLIVWDFIHYAKTNGIPVGPGRGSAAGSMVSYCLGITTIDPLKYSLYFERFLNPERVSMPDIDVDFCYVRRQEVIDYVTRKYGADHVAQIVTFGTMAARGAVRDVGRALNIPYSDCDMVAKLIPNELHITLDKALAASEQLRGLYESDETIHRLIDVARALEGMPRHASTHAAGVVITKEPVDHYVPLAANDGNMVTQFVMTTLEELGLLKMDFLGLRNLTVLADSEKMVQKMDPSFRLDEIPLEDDATYQMLAQGKTCGVFQLESAGITNVVTGLKPHSIEDITAVVALYRPGPMQSIPRYIACKHDPSQVKYKHPLLKDILDVTYGCMVYQEQVMEVFRVMAGYSLGKADMVRRAMSKKKMKELEKERTNFIFGNEELGIDGAVKRGVDQQTAESIFDEIMDFANYAFNKAHAVSYAVVSFQTAYMKCHYPSQYMAALLTSVLDSSGKVSEYIMECRSMGIAVLPPDVNESMEGFVSLPDTGAIRFGLAAIRNVGRTFLKSLEKERKEQGLFTSFEDFCERMYGYDLNKRALDGLIKAGTFDSMGYKRNQLLAVYETVLSSVASSRRRNLEGQMDLFGMSEESSRRETIALPRLDDLSKREILAMEKETTGLYLSGHPMDSYTELVEQADCAQIRRIEEDLGGENEQPVYHDGMNVVLAGVISSIRLKTTKNNSMMAYVTVEDLTGSMELVVFSSTLQQARDVLQEDRAVFIAGRIDAREDEAPKLIVSAVFPLEEASIGQAKEACGSAGRRQNRRRNEDNARPQRQNEAPRAPTAAGEPCRKRLYLRVNGVDDPRMEQVKPLLATHNGDLPVILFDSGTRKQYMAPRSLWTYNNLRLFDEIRFILGPENVIMKKVK